MGNLRKATPQSLIKAVDETGVIEGYASTFDVLDQGGDVVVKGAYAATLKERGPAGIRMLFDHTPSEVIGVWEQMREDDTGLWCRGRLLIDAVQRAREVYALVKAGAINGLSIGYRVVNAARDAANGARLLQEVDLREVSVVTFPMNETSLIASVKGQLPTEREFERWLTQDAGFSRSQARQIISGGFKALKAMPGAGAGDSEDVWAAVRDGLADLTNVIRK